MKKLICLLLVLLGTHSTFTAFAEEENIDITASADTKTGHESGTNNPRNIHQNFIEATIDADLGMLAFYFNENLSNVTITVKNANGNIVASTTCNTSITTSTYLNVPTASGAYSIYIYGDCVTAYGEYDIN